MSSIVGSSPSGRRRCSLADDVAAHLGVGEHLPRAAVGDDPAVVEREHALGVALDELHIVLDEQYRRPPRRATASSTRSMSANFSSALDAAGRLVEQEHAAASPTSRHGDVEKLAHALRQRRVVRVAVASSSRNSRERLARELLGLRPRASALTDERRVPASDDAERDQDVVAERRDCRTAARPGTTGGCRDA